MFSRRILYHYITLTDKGSLPNNRKTSFDLMKKMMSYFVRKTSTKIFRSFSKVALLFKPYYCKLTRIISEALVLPFIKCISTTRVSEILSNLYKMHAIHLSKSELLWLDYDAILIRCILSTLGLPCHSV